MYIRESIHRKRIIEFYIYIDTVRIEMLDHSLSLTFAQDTYYIWEHFWEQEVKQISCLITYMCFK